MIEGLADIRTLIRTKDLKAGDCVYVQKSVEDKVAQELYELSFQSFTIPWSAAKPHFAGSRIKVLGVEVRAVRPEFVTGGFSCA